MTETATAYQSDTAYDQLAQRNAELEHDKAALAEQLDAAETRAESLAIAVRKARLYAGEHLEAKAGLGIIHILEKALKEGS